MIGLSRLKQLLPVLACFAAVAVQGQIGMNLTLNRTAYMQYEPVYACVTLRNDSGRPLVIGEDPRLQGFLLFEHTDSKGRLVPKRTGARELSITGLLLRAGEIKKLVIPLNRYYDIDKDGIYRVNAYISHSMLQDEFQSNIVRFDVEPGVDVWSRTVGLPELGNNSGGEQQPVQTRTYRILAMQENAVKYYYLMIRDATKIYGVMRIGKALGGEKLRQDVDMLSRLHILIPISPKVFRYLCIRIDGSVQADEYRKITATIPSLVRDPGNGMITLVGGTTARAGVDYKDPRAGMVTATELMREEYIPGVTDRPQAPAAGGLVDLGKEVAPPTNSR